jgi:hypothetical protein
MVSAKMDPSNRNQLPSVPKIKRIQYIHDSRNASVLAIYFPSISYHDTQ